MVGARAVVALERAGAVEVEPATGFLPQSRLSAALMLGPCCSTNAVISLLSKRPQRNAKRTYNSSSQVLSLIQDTGGGT